jgi:hypothetical protein
MLNACGARSGAGGGAQEDARAFLCALEMVAAALQYISRSGPLRERKYDYWTHALVSWNFTRDSIETRAMHAPHECVVHT